MTAASFLLTVGLAALYLALAAEPMRPGRRIALAVACLAALPLAFGPFVPISHFIFEATGRSMLWAAQGVATLLLASLVWRLAARWQSGVDADLRLQFAGVLASQTIWLGSAIWLSDYEGGRTPGFWDSPIYALDWLSAVGMCILLAVAAWHAAGSSIALRSLIGVYLLLLAAVVFATPGL